MNQLTKLKLQIPKIEKEIEALSMRNIELQYQLENFSSPKHLLELAKQPEYSHLKFPLMEEVLVISSEIAKKYEPPKGEAVVMEEKTYSKWPFFLGAKQ